MLFGLRIVLQILLKPKILQILCRAVKDKKPINFVKGKYFDWIQGNYETKKMIFNRIFFSDKKRKTRSSLFIE
jgi:hypothetical protein